MSIWAGFGAQLPKSYETQRRTRLDTLNAFNEFKKGNPYATGAEFQQFIDTAAGGSNYLRRGLPGKEIIEAIDKENKGNRDRRAMSQYVTEIDQMAKMDGSLVGGMDQAILGMGANATEDDYGTAFDTFMNTLPEGAGRDMYGKKAQPRFNQGYRQKLVTGQIRENLPDALRYVKSSAGTDVTAEQLGQYFGLPQDVAKGLLDRTTELYGQEQKKLQQDSFEGAISQGLRLLAATPTMNASALTAQLKDIYGETGMDTNFSSDFFKNVSADALERKRITDDDRNRTILNGARTTAGRIKESMRNDAITQTSIIANDKKGWTQNYLAQMTENLSDEEFKFFYGVEKGKLDVSKFYDEWDELVEISRADQRKQQETTRIASGAAAVEAQQRFVENNNKRAEDLFAYAKENGKGVETILSQSYDMNPAFAQQASEMTNQIILAAGDNEQPTPQQIVEQIRGNAEVMGLTRPISDAANAYGQQMRQVNGAFDVITAEDYFAGFQTEVTEKFKETEDYVALIMAKDMPLEMKKTLLAQVQSEINQFSTTSMNNHVQRQRRQDRWVEHGTGGYNADRHDALGQEVEGMSVAIGSFIEAASLDVIEQIKAAENSPDVNPETSQVATPLFNATLKKVVDNQGSLEGVNRAETALDAMNQLKKDLRSAAWQGRNDTNKDTWEQLTMVKTYLDYELIDGGFLGRDTTIQDKISLDVNEYKKFIADPMAYMLADEEFLSQHPGYRELLGGVEFQ